MATLILTLLPLLFLASSASALLQVSIDCGASSPYTDAHGIKWVTDDSYISNGDIQTIKTASDSTPEPWKTLRVFSSRKKNCYTVPIQGHAQVRVRADFNYGNYDGKSAPPSFPLLINGDDWGTIQTSNDKDIFIEVVYVVTKGSISVCLGQSLPGQLPFVSSIQVWELDPHMYANFDPTTGLTLTTRIAYGAPNTIRYPDDPYDRIWDAPSVANGFTVLKSDAKVINTNITDQPPAAVMATAITPTDPTSSIVLYPNLPDLTLEIYMNLYFAETSQLSSQDKRSFALVVDGTQDSDAIVPDYASASEYYLGNVTPNSKDQFTLQVTTDSTLPPIINAMEVFVVSATISNGTNPTDVSGLAKLTSQFVVLNDWSGDPCLPQNYSWNWIGCSSDDIPRVTSINLSGYGLYGELPDFSTLDALQTIDMHNNSLGGAIPALLGKLPNLKELNLADNSFSGPIPASISGNNKIKLETSGNPNLCATGQSCKVLSAPNPPPGAKRSRTSNANRRSTISSFLGIIVSFAIFVFAF